MPMGSPDQIKYLIPAATNFFRNYSILNPMPRHLNPLHFPLKNDGGYVDEALLFLLLQIIFGYVILVGSFRLRELRACGEAVSHRKGIASADKHRPRNDMSRIYGVAPTKLSAYSASSYPGRTDNALRQFSTAPLVSPFRYSPQPCHSQVSSDISVRCKA